MKTGAENKTVLIVEPNYSGHHLYYVRLLAEFASQKGWTAVLGTSAAALESVEARVHLSMVRSRLKIRVLEDFRLGAIERLTRMVRPDVTVIPDGDAKVGELFRSRHWHGSGSLNILVMRSSGQSHQPLVRLVGSAAKRVRFFLVGRLARVSILVLESGVVPRRSSGLVRTVRDPIEFAVDATTVELLRTSYGIDHEHQWIGILGRLDPRKNVELVLAAAKAASSTYDSSVGVLLAGKADPKYEDILQAAIADSRSEDFSIVRVDRDLDDVELDSLIGMCTSVVAAHSNYGPSGIVGKSAMAGVPLVLAGSSSLRRDSQYLKGRAVWSGLDIGSLTEAICEAMNLNVPDGLTGVGTPTEFASLMFTNSVTSERESLSP